MIDSLKSKQFVIFLITGGLAAFVNFGSRIIYNNWMSFSSSIVLSYITGMVTAFILAKVFVFKKTTRSLQNSILYFLLVNLVAVLQTWLISMLLVYYVLPYIHISSYVNEIAHAVGVIVPVFSSYYGHKYLSFK